METDRFYLELTIEEAELAYREGTYPIGALVVDAKLTTLPTEDTLARSADMTCWMVYRLPLRRPAEIKGPATVVRWYKSVLRGKAFS